MLNQKNSWKNITGLGILIFMVSGLPAISMPSKNSNSTTQFQHIEQPLAIKTLITIGGLGLISLELWWFLFSKPKIQKALSNKEIQEVNITVDGGYDPSFIVVKSGQLVRLNFLRRDPNNCLEKVLFPDFYIAQDLPLNQVIPVEFTPEKSGKYSFTCGMNMFRGEIEVQ